MRSGAHVRSRRDLLRRSRPCTCAADPSRAFRRHVGAEAAQVASFAVEAARLLHDRHCADVLLLDVRGLSDVTDYILIGSGTSDRQMVSVGQELEDLAKLSDLARFGREVDLPTTWLVLDFVDVVVHLFDPPVRAHYDLEMMWGDAAKVPWQR